MKKEFHSCCFNQLIVFGLLSSALGLSHKPTIYFNKKTLSPEDKEHNVSMVDTVQICYRTDDKIVLEESCITSKYIMVPYRFSIMDNTNWMKKVWLRTFPLLNWKDNRLDRAMFFALEPPSDTIHVPEFSGKILSENIAPIFKFTLKTYQKTIDDSVMFFIDSKNVDQITCINSKCFYKNGECTDRICSCSCNYNMFQLTYYTDIVCAICTFGVEWRFANTEKGSIFKRYLSRTYNSTGFGNLELHSEILRGAYQDETIDVSATEGSPFRQSKNGDFVFLAVLNTMIILLLLYMIIHLCLHNRRQQQITRRCISYVSKSPTADKNNYMCDYDYVNRDESIILMTEQENFKPFNNLRKEKIKDIEEEEEEEEEEEDVEENEEEVFDNIRSSQILKCIVVKTISSLHNRRQQQITTRYKHYVSKSPTADKIKDIEEEEEEVEEENEEDFKPFNNLRKEKFKDIKEEDFKPFNNLRKEKIIDIEEEDVKPFNKFSNVKIKDTEVEESASRDGRHEKIATSYEHDPLKHRYEQKGNPTKLFYSTAKYEQYIMAKTYDNGCIDLKAKKLKEIIKSCRHEIEECERQRIQMEDHIKKLLTTADVLQFQEKSLEIERNSLSQQRESAKKLLRKQISDLNHNRNTGNELHLKQNNKEHEG